MSRGGYGSTWEPVANMSQMQTFTSFLLLFQGGAHLSSSSLKHHDTATGARGREE